MTPARETRIITVWVRKTQGPSWDYSVGRDGTIKGRHRKPGRRQMEHMVLGTDGQALAEVPTIPPEFLVVMNR